MEISRPSAPTVGNCIDLMEKIIQSPNTEQRVKKCVLEKLEFFSKSFAFSTAMDQQGNGMILYQNLVKYDSAPNEEIKKVYGNNIEQWKWAAKVAATKPEPLQKIPSPSFKTFASLGAFLTFMNGELSITKVLLQGEKNPEDFSRWIARSTTKVFDKVRKQTACSSLGCEETAEILKQCRYLVTKKEQRIEIHDACFQYFHKNPTELWLLAAIAPTKPSTTFVASLEKLLLPGEKLERPVDQKEICRIALQRDPKNSYLWNLMGEAMKLEEKVTINGMVYGKKEIFLESINQDNSYYKPHYHISFFLNPLSYLNRAIELNPMFAEAYLAMGKGLHPGHSACLSVGLRGQMESKTDLFKKAIDLKPTLGEAYYCLAGELKDGEMVNLASKLLSKEDLLNEAAKNGYNIPGSVQRKRKKTGDASTF